MSRTAEPRGRPNEAAEPNAVRTRILRGAAKVFGERGYSASSVEAILEAAQVSRRTFYRTFRSKEDVLAALFATKDRQSVLGTYSIDENGDTTLTDYGVYKIEDNALSFDQVIRSATE